MLGKKIHNVRYAMNGVKIAWQEELSFRVQVIAAALAVTLGLFFGITIAEWLSLIIIVGLVMAAEIFNTALEELCDKYKADPDPHIGKIKDLGAGAVLVASVAAIVVGAIIFIPHIIEFLS